MFKATVILVLVVATQAAPGPTQSVVPRATIYSSYNQGGVSIFLPATYAPDLSQQNFDNRAYSACVTGLWVFYVNPNYNTGANSGVEYIFGPNNYCTNFMSTAGYISSARFVGSPYDYRTDTFTLFEEDYFQGNEEYTFVDLPNLVLAGRHRSIVITGQSPWTIYDNPNYSGNSICLFPAQNPDYEPYLITDVSSIDIPYGSIRSVKKGCVGHPQSLDDGQHGLQSGNGASEDSSFGQAKVNV
jgi:hypothetical protein